MKKPMLLVLVSDLHCGSKVGLCPPSVENGSGNIITHGKNLHQAWLWSVWQELTDKALSIVGIDNAVLAMNGDATEGSHHRNERELIDADIAIHTDMAAECLTPLAKACSKRFVTLGTECHTLEMEHVLARKMGAETGKARDKWLIEINGCLVDMAHHMTTTSRAYLEASAMSILMGNARLQSVRAGHRPADIYLRAHRHCGGHYSDGSGLFCVTGAFQMLTRHGHKVVTDSIPRPSIIVLDWRNKECGSLPMVHELTAKPPQYEITRL
jgi:hypothetical protein